MTALGPGIRVKCIYNGPWKCSDYPGLIGPDYGTVWTVGVIEQYGEYPPRAIYVSLLEWPNKEQFFLAKHFHPLDGETELARLRAIAANPHGKTALPSREPAEAKA